MKRLHLSAGAAAAFLLAAHPAPAAWESAGFVHPGIYTTAAELEFIRKKLAENAEPWTSAMEPLRKAADLNMPIHADAEVNADMDHYMGGDSQRAYALALYWALTGDQAYADRAIEILNTWSSTLKRILVAKKPSEEMLTCGWNAHFLANAAELLKHYTPPGGQPSGWKEEDIAKFRTNILAPMVEVLRPGKPNHNGNWNAAIMTSLAAIAVFNDDRELFDHAIDMFWGRYAPPEKGLNVGHLAAYIYPSGQSQESDRDYGHVQMGLSFYASMCEIAWNQGIDLYSAYDNLLLTGYEHMAKYMLGEEVAFERFPQTRTDVISTKFRGLFSNAYETAYQHYVYRKGLEMPYTKRVLEEPSVLKVYSKSAPRPFRPEGGLPCLGIPWGTLISHMGPEDPQAAKN
jgi:hypothetical protein